MSQAVLKENKMGTRPVKSLIISMSLPMMISMLVQALYNIVDSVFVSWLDKSALTAVTVAFPMQSLMIAVASGTGVGINAMLSTALGARDFEKSDSAANKGIFLALCSYIIFLLLGIFATGPFIDAQLETPEAISYGTAYLRIVTTLSIGLFCQMTFERLLQATGQTFYSMISQTVGAVVNMILDPIMIFGFLGFPAMGVAGAAYATVIGQSIAAVVAICFNLKVNKEIRFGVDRIFARDPATIRRIYAVGIPSVLMMSIMSVMSFFMNKILRSFSETAISVYGVYFRLQSFFFMPVFGMNNGIIPVLAYNYGAKKRARIDEALRFGLILAVCIMTLGTVIFELFPDRLLDIFHADEDMKSIGIIALRIIAIHYPFAAVAISLGTVFQAFSKSIYSLIISICRQLLILVPVAWAIAYFTNDVNKVWFSFLASEGISCILSVIFFKKVYSQTVKPIT